MTYKYSIALAFILTFMGVADAQERVKVDGVSVVVGKNIVLNSDIGKFIKDLESRTEGKIEITDCEILEEIMIQKLIAHHAVVDSIVVTDAEVNSEVEQRIQYFVNSLGGMDETVAYYGFTDEEDLRTELSMIQKEQMLIQRERSSINENTDVTPEEVRTNFKNLEVDNNLPEFSAEIELGQIVRDIIPSEEEVNRVIEELNQIKKEIEEGYSFRLKAILNSDDPSVTDNGGKFTLTRESNLVKEFKEVSFSLDEGEISEPFKTTFGYHIILLDKIRGQERDVRHILIQPVISESEMTAATEELEKIRTQILNNEISFEDAVLEYSQDKVSALNKGAIINTQTNDTHFDLTRMDPNLYKRVSDLNAGEITKPFLENVNGEKTHKIIFMRSKTAPHKADFDKDYEKIQQLTLQKKQEETVEAWVKDKIGDTYIKLNKEFKKCSFNLNWKKE